MADEKINEALLDKALFIALKVYPVRPGAEKAAEMTIDNIRKNTPPPLRHVLDEEFQKFIQEKLEKAYAERYRYISEKMIEILPENVIEHVYVLCSGDGWKQMDLLISGMGELLAKSDDAISKASSEIFAAYQKKVTKEAMETYPRDFSEYIPPIVLNHR